MTDELRIRILIVDDHALFRRGLAALLAKEPAFEVAGEAASGREAVVKARDLMPDVILMDLSMPDMDGLEATRQIKQQMPYVKIVMLTVSDDDQSLFEAIKHGAQGYLLKKIEPQALFSALRRIAHGGEASLSRSMATRVIGEFARQSQPTPSFSVLSPRELAVLELVADGKTNKEIGAALAIAENTVKNHLKNILEKLHLENRVQAATFALRQGLVDKSPGSPA